MTRLRLLRGALLTGLLALVPLAIAQAVVVGERTTSIVSPPVEAGVADGPSDNVAFSQDGHRATLMAYDSSATNLVSGDTNGKRDVFLLTRGRGDGNVGGTLRRVSVTSRGRQANGDSTNPSIGGDARARPRCLTFESTATNIDRADRRSDSDVFLYDIRRRRASLVSVRHTNARNAVVDGECEYVTYESRNRVYVRAIKLRKTFQIARGANPDQNTNGKGVAYERGGQIYHQGFEQKFRSRRRGGPFIRKRGREVLVSRNASGGRGNGTSANPSVDDNGFYVAFESTATNLCEAGQGCPGVGQTDRNGAVSDVFRRNLNARRAPTNEHMALVSYSQGCTRDAPDAKGVDAQGDGPSNNPAMTGAGENILFDSEATNLRESSGIRISDGNGPIRDIYYWNFPRERPCGNVSRESRGDGDRALGQVYNGASVKPAASNRANYVGFTSLQTGQSGEAGTVFEDVFMRFLGASDEGRS